MSLLSLIVAFFAVFGFGLLIGCLIGAEMNNRILDRLVIRLLEDRKP